MVSLDELITKLRVIFEDNHVDIQEVCSLVWPVFNVGLQVMTLMESYKSNVHDWGKYAKFDDHKY